MIVEPKVLIISNKFDFSTDLITNKLGTFNVSFLRLNRDQLHEYQIRFNPVVPELNVKLEGMEFRFTEKTVFSIYFRAPTFLRDIVQENLDGEEQLYRTQWAAFVRALSVFEQVKWVNNPVSTYRAEIKALQLKYAKQSGFLVPETLISNVTEKSDRGPLALKSIDTAIVSTGNKEAFVYTTIVDGSDLEHMVYSSPFFIQQALTPKIDIRITVVDDSVIAVKIKSKNGIAGDWRKHEGQVDYETFSLPENVRKMCLEFSRSLDLNFAAIDMVIYDSRYYFIEVNPTGEWAWLQKNTGYDFCSLIAKSLCNENLEQ